MNQTLDISRFGALLKRYVVENRKQLFFLTGVMWGVMMLMASFMGRTYHDALLYVGHISYNSLHLFYVFALLAFSCLFGSYAFSSLKGKRQRISTLMVPASMFEKYAVRLVIYVLGFYAVYTVGMCLADVCHYVSAGGGLLLPCLEMIDVGNTLDMELFLTVAFMQSIYVLGSAVWPRLSFFKTFLALFVLMLGSMFYGDVFAYLMRLTGFWFVGALTLGCYVLAWLRFRRVQVIQRFM